MARFTQDFLEKYPYYNEQLDIEKRVSLLMERLTLKEKFKLLSGRIFSLWVTSPIRRLKVKSLGMSDGPNGLSFHSSWGRNTKYPTVKCLAASWNRDLAERYGKIVAEEVRGVGRHIILAPGVNIDRTPLNGRTFEYYSEDPYLTKELAIPYVKGVQSQRIGACFKHYATNNQETNRHTVSSEVDERTLNEIYLYAFKEIVQKADPWSAMGCYNRINGIYGCENKELLFDTLINKWGFSGYVVSDWWATKPLNNPANCIKAGLSLEMPRSYAYKMKLLAKSYAEGKFTDKDLDFVIHRLLRVMFRVGLFDDPEKLPKGSRHSEKQRTIAREIAEEGIVLLKNEKNILPLDETKVKTLAVIGPNADRKLGRLAYGGSAAVIPKYDITPLAGIKEFCGEKIEVVKDPVTADYCLLVLGLNHDKGQDCENIDRYNLSLPKKQIKLLEKTIKQNPNTIVILVNGSPLEMSDWIDKVPAILEAWYPGQEGGRAIADILFGKITPSGKLPITFPQKIEDSPAHKNKKTFPGDDKVFYEEGVFVGYRHFDKMKIEPLFPFGFGLSYTTFEYKNLKIDSQEISPKKQITVSVDITNTGKFTGAEIVQLYVGDLKASVDRPIKELKNFAKIKLQSGETKTVSMKISEDDLKFYDVKSHNWIAEEGEFNIYIGSSSRDIRFTEKITLKKIA
ncbi:MAG: glycoside hydrolase family 3 C-terminal domain-containing protein [Candidatus Thorarchaeota archaeon]